MKMNRILFTLVALLLVMNLSAAIPDKAKVEARVRPAEWANLVNGGQFKDLFEPMPIMRPLTSDTWGGDNVKPRDVSNGIEHPDWSYWGGSPIKDDAGQYHLYTARWPEDEPRGHFGYFDSIIVHAVADHPMGPYFYKDTLGPGHNPELYQTKSGDYMVYSTHGRFFVSKSLEGPWKAGTYTFDKRGRYAFRNFVNFSFASRDDGSQIAVSRRGYMWASPDGGENWSEVSAESVYPKVPGIFEDPVMWKDDVQHNVIVNDWKGRIAYHLRSKDGFHWKTEPGEAYSPGIARYEDGTLSDWYKYERIRMLQDEYGRPTQAHFAVIDSDKYSDKQSDIHSSKHIVIPLTVGRLIEVMNRDAITEETKRIQVRVKAEEGFDPHQDLNLKSLRFGASEEINYGRGSKLIEAKKSGNDAVLIFGGEGSGITTDNFAGKLLGKSTTGKLLFGWARLPEVEFKVPVLSALAPVFEFTHDGLEAYVEVTNFGEIDSGESTIKVLVGDQLIATGKVRSLKPFEKSMVRLVCDGHLPKGATRSVTVLLESEGLPEESFTTKVSIPVE